MTWIREFWKSNLVKKAVMAVTGIILFGFVLGHMIGNLKLFLGPKEGAYALDTYAEWLRAIGTPGLPEGGALWVARLALLGAVVLHIWAAWAVSRASWQARDKGYEKRRYTASDYASRTMRWSGVIILAFVVYHLLHFTWGTVHPDFIPGAVHHNVVVGFQVWWVSLFYIVANVLLGLHLYHGLWSMFQSLGWNHPTFNPWRRNFAVAFAVLVTLGNVSFPLAVLAGWVTAS